MITWHFPSTWTASAESYYLYERCGYSMKRAYFFQFVKPGRDHRRVIVPHVWVIHFMIPV